MTFAEAQRAIYIDFEQPMGSPRNPPLPALLGVLLGATGENFEQLVVNERLAPAAVAKPRCRVVALQAAVTGLLEQALTEQRRIVGWSNFDRDRLVAALPSRTSDIDSSYVNPLSMARQWARLIHPAFPIVRAAPKSPRHTLVQYARLAGYRHTAAMAQGEPAHWINSTLDRLAKGDGRYGTLSDAGKRDWRNLLHYNRHDCLALRHVVLKASRELESWRSYERTQYCVDDGTRRVCFTNGSGSGKLEALLRRHKAKRWAFLTAWNPASEQLSAKENDRRQHELVRLLEAGGFRRLPGEGVPPDDSWPPEQSLMVFDISPGKAVALARQFGQLAILVGRRGEPARLVPSAPTPPARTAS